jgi:integrase
MATIKVEENNGSIRIRVQVQGRRYTFTPIYRAKYSNKSDLKRAQAVAVRIQSDIALGDFDTTLERYKDKPKPKTSNAPVATTKPQPAKVYDLKELWPLFVKYKESLGLAYSTLELDYRRRVGNILDKMPSTSVDNDGSVKIRDWLLENKSPKQANKIMARLDECARWAIDSQLLTHNPFHIHHLALAKAISRSAKEPPPDPFTKEERDLIIHAFSSSPLHASYAPLVRFLFFVGCRPSEAAGLMWKDICDNSLTFRKSFVLSKDRDALKTQASRVITLNSQARQAIEDQRKTESKSDYVFVSPKGCRLNWDSFNRNAWKDILKTLPEIKYRNPYQMRHTYITLNVQAGESLVDIAHYCGNSPRTILSNYAGITRGYVPPTI